MIFRFKLDLLVTTSLFIQDKVSVGEMSVDAMTCCPLEMNDGEFKMKRWLGRKS